jgi:hypothetical protein
MRQADADGQAVPFWRESLGFEFPTRRRRIGLGVIGGMRDFDPLRTSGQKVVRRRVSGACGELQKSTARKIHNGHGVGDS